MNADLLEVIKFHGHYCPGVSIGYRAAKIGLRELGCARAEDEELLVISETDACGVDAIQVLTGCTLGKGNLILRDFGKQVFTFARRSDEKALRVALRYGVIPFSQAATPQQQKQETCQYLENAVDERLFSIRWVDRPLPSPARIFKSLLCAHCGEGVMEARAHLHDGAILCPECYGPSYTRGW